jgi:hypothetical protein
MLNPGGKIDKIVELLGRTNEILEDMVYVEGNLPTGHLSTIRTGLPEVAWRLLNYGVPNGKAQTAQVTDTCGMLEAYSEVDKRVAGLNGNTAEFRLSQDKAFVESMNQAMATTLFYGDTRTNPERFLGLAPRFSDALNAGNKEQLVNGGGSGSDNTSVWLVVWSPETVHGIYPKGTTAGIDHQNLGEVTLFDAAGNKYQGYRGHYEWHTGLVVADWRYVVRICNIDVSNLISGSGAADLVNLMIEASERIPSLRMGKAAWYCNRTVRTALRKQIIAKSNVNLTWDSVAGKRVLAFDEIPVRRCDAILSTEAAISFS